jgi:hypothetical protein
MFKVGSGRRGMVLVRWHLADWSVRCHGVTTLTHEIPKTAENCLEQTQNDGRRGRPHHSRTQPCGSRTLRRHRQRVG